METSLTIIALAWWPWPPRLGTKGKVIPTPRYSSSLAISLSLAALACVMRPSNAVIWLTLGFHLLSSNPPTPQGVYILSLSFFIAIAASLASFLIDTTFYQTLTFTPLRFLHENVFHSISLFYGSNPLHFYLTQGIPIIMMTQLPFLVHGVWLALFRRDHRGGGGLKPLGAAAGITILTFSMLGHKEWRFLHPILPILHLFTAFSLVSFYNASPQTGGAPALRVRSSHVVILLVSFVPAMYLTAFHSIAQVTILDYLRTLPAFELRSVAFLMPCHSTPWQSQLHRRDLELGGLRSGEGGHLWFITCEPPTSGATSVPYRDQSDYFYASPSKYLLDRFPSTVDPSFPPSPFSSSRWTHTWPSHLVFFQALIDADPEVERILKEKGYTEVERRWNSIWHDDERRKGDVLVWKWVRRKTIVE